MDELKGNFQFDAYKVDYIKFKYNPNFASKEPITVNFNVKTEIGINDELSKGKVSIQTMIFENAEENVYPFSLSVGISGFYSLKESVTQEELTNFCQINGTAALFPFLRSVIADITRIANVEPLIMPLLNIHALTMAQKQSEGQPVVIEK